MKFQAHLLIFSLIASLSTAPAQDAQMRTKILEHFPQADANGDGKLSSAELDALSKKALQKYPHTDTDGDGVLSKQERQAPMRKAMARKGAKGKGSGSVGKKPAANSSKKVPDLANVKYGEHERNVLDIWFADRSEHPTPLAIYIHGGGFKSGSKDKLKPGDLSGFLDAGISVASINYRLLPESPLPTPHLDAHVHCSLSDPGPMNGSWIKIASVSLAVRQVPRYRCSSPTMMTWRTPIVKIRSKGNLPGSPVWPLPEARLCPPSFGKTSCRHTWLNRLNNWLQPRRRSKPIHWRIGTRKRLRKAKLRLETIPL